MKLIVGMLVRNEADRYLKQVISGICSFADELVVLDDNSTDDTVRTIETEADIPVQTSLVDADAGFHNEIALRKMLYRLVLEREPDWFMIVDADEVCDGATRSRVESLMRQTDIDCWGFRFFDMWDESRYRADALWRAHEFYPLMLIRNIEGFQPVWNERPHHCGRLPVNFWSLRTRGSDLIRIKHYGWAKEADRLRKYERYMQYDPHGIYGSLEQYRSILDPNPNLLAYPFARKGGN